MACVVKRDPEVEKSFWNEAKGLLASGVEPEDVVKQIAAKHGLGTDAVGSILIQNKQLFQLTNEAWAKQAQVAGLKASARSAVANANKPLWLKVMQYPYELTRRSLTVGHGGVIPFTHTRNSMLIPGEAKMFGETVKDAYSYMTPKTGSARWRADMATLRSDKMYNFASRVGLDIKIQSRPVGMGMSRWTLQSFDALKTLRLKLFKKYWNQLDPADKTFERSQDLAKRINHATGVVNSPPIVNKLAGAGMFAPKLRFSKYASAVDVATSPFSAKRFAKLAAINIGLLGINDLVNRHILNRDEDKINWTNPSRGDWMRMKIAGLTVPMSPLFETMRLPVALAADFLDPRQKDKFRVAAKEVASAVHPGINAIYGGLTGTDLATGKTLPFKGASQLIYGDYRNKKPEKQIGAGEYAAGYAPIPAQPIIKEMAKEGVPPGTSANFLKAYAESILSGALGTHAYPNVPYQDKPFPHQARPKQYSSPQQEQRAAQRVHHYQFGTADVPAGTDSTRKDPSVNPQDVSFVMCRPRYLSTRIKNNVWMKSEKVDKDRACSQWNRSVNVIRSFGVPVIEIEPQPNCQDQIYTANVGVAIKPYVILSKFKAPGRDCEIAPAYRLFTKLGYKCLQSPYFFEGEADLKKWKDGVYFGGIGQFSDPEAYKWMEKTLGIQIIPLKEVNKKLYHLDCSLFVVDEKNFLVCKDGLSDESFRLLNKLGNVITVPTNLAITGCTNAVKIPGKPIVLSGTFNPEMPEYREAMEWMNKTFDQFGWSVILLDVDEYDKSGADLSCSVMRLDFKP